MRRPHGLRGELLMDVETDFPERLRSGSTIFLGRTHKPMLIESIRAAQSGMLVKLGEVDTPEAAAQHRNETVFVAAKNRPALAEGTYYHHQVIGSRVVDEQDRTVGHITEILQTGANDVYVVRELSGSELLLPAIDSVILEIEPDHRRIRVRLPEFFDERPDG
jgi:16S rRNA processing protein RimM